MRKMSSQTKILLLILIALCIVMTVISPKEFLKITNIQSMLAQMPEFGILSLGMMLVILTGGIDLSIINAGVLSSIAGALCMKMCLEREVHWAVSILLGVLVILFCSMMCGVLNGYMVGYLSLPPILVTLGTMSLYQGISMNITNGSSISGFAEKFMMIGKGTILGIPVPMVIYIVVIFLFSVFLRRTPQGVYTYMIGSNKTALEYSGVNVKKVLCITMIITAMMAGIAFIIMTSRYNSAKVGYGESYLMKSITAVVLGGTAISGGEGKISGVVISVAILQVLSTGLNMLLINGHVADVIIGCILILVLGLNHVIKRYTEKKAIKRMTSVIGRMAD